MDEGDGRARGAAKIQRVEDMPVYQSFYRLAVEVEHITRTCGADFRWLRQPALRSSESVCANMTEGFYSQYSTEYLQSLYRCRREARETVTHLQYGSDVRTLDRGKVGAILAGYEDALQQLSGLVSGVGKKIAQRGKSKPRWIAEEEMEYGNDDGGTTDTWGLLTVRDNPSAGPVHEPQTVSHKP